MVKINAKLPINYSKEDMLLAVMSFLPIEREEIKELRLVRRKINIDDKKDIHYDVTIAFESSPEREKGLLKMKKKVSEYPDFSLDLPSYKGKKRPIVVGAGPAGLFAALVLAEQGAMPLLIERGLSVDERNKRVSAFNNFGILDTECNVQFGEGGAGTYSDGKLKVGSMDKYKMKILFEFVASGATEDITYSLSAHLGTDKLSGIVKKIREKIISLGGKVKFGTRLTDIMIKNGRVVGIVCESESGIEEYECEDIILATGHSARDVFELLLSKGAVLEPRGFGIGVRIEHPLEYTNRLVYGKGYAEELEGASYHLVTHLENGRSVYSFCMCPGGSVVAATSAEGGIVTNGMSEYLRNGENSNAAFLVSVIPDDFGSEHPLAGIELQKKIEKKAYALTGSYKAPGETLGSLKNGGICDFGVKHSYPIGVEKNSASDYLPEYICSSLKASISDFESWMPGFYLPEAAVTGPETRTTSPVRVLRGDSGEAAFILGLYPCGEGAGYAGGIVSSAKDGIFIAEKILKKFEKDI